MPVNQNTYKKRIPIGVVNKEEFLALFATNPQFRKYAKQRLPVSSRNALIKRAQQYCEIEYIGQNQYRIDAINNQYFSKQLVKAINSNDLLTLSLLLTMVKQIAKNSTSSEEDGCFWIPSCNRIAKFGITIKNYPMIKFNRDLFSSLSGIPIENINDFIETTDRTLQYYTSKALDIIPSACIKQKEVRVLTRVKTELKTDFINGNLTIKPNVITTSIATDEESALIDYCIKQADESCRIDGNTRKRYAGKMALAWQNCIKQQYKKHGILRAYDAILFTNVNKKQCNEFLTTMQQRLCIGANSTTVRKELAKHILLNAYKRHGNNQTLKTDVTSDIDAIRKSEDYIGIFKELCSIAIMNTEDYTEDIAELIDKEKPIAFYGDGEQDLRIKVDNRVVRRDYTK